jgi:predicted permease
LVSVVAVISLAFGIGANVAVFSVFYQALLRPLPVLEPGRLVNLNSPGRKPGNVSTDGAGSSDSVFSYPMFRDLERTQTAFAGVAAHRRFAASLVFKGQTQVSTGVLVSGQYFDLLGLRPALGRLLGPADDRRPGDDRVAVLSYDYWSRQLDKSPTVIDQTLVVNGHAMTIVGVAPAGFEGTTVIDPPQVFVPMTMSREMRPGWTGFADRRDWSVYLFARLRPSISIDVAQQAINIPFRAITREVEAPLYTDVGPEIRDALARRAIALESGATGLRPSPGRIWVAFALLLTVTGIVLVVACSNVAQLLLARAAARAREIAIRVAIGASRRQLVEQLLGESFLLAACGGLGGLIVARWTLALIGSFLPARASMLVDLSLDLSVWLFIAGITFGAGLLMGLFPAWQSTKPDVLPALKSQSTHLTGARSATRFRLSLATAQIGLSMVLMVMAGMFARSLWNLSEVDLGFESANLLTFRLSPARNGYDAARASALFDRVEQELASIPGIGSASISTAPLLTGTGSVTRVAVDGADNSRRAISAGYALVGPDYFNTLGVARLTGRDFTRADSAGSPQVAIVNEALADQLQLGPNPVGTQLRVGAEDDATGAVEIIGMVRDTKYEEVKAAALPQLFMPYRQHARGGTVSVYVRATQAPATMTRAIPAAVARLDPALPVEDLRTMSDQVRENIGPDRLIGTLSMISAGLATFLAAVGLYGMLAYTVTQRTREIGVRMALGADRGDVRRLILTQVVRMFVIGGLSGIAIAIALCRVAQSLLFGLESYDPTVVAVSVTTLVLVALGASLVPASRASRIEPITALRFD